MARMILLMIQVEEYEDARDVSGHRDCSTQPCQVELAFIILVLTIVITIIVITIIVTVLIIILLIPGRGNLRGSRRNVHLLLHGGSGWPSLSKQVDSIFFFTHLPPQKFQDSFSYISLFPDL